MVYERLEEDEGMPLALCIVGTLGLIGVIYCLNQREQNPSSSSQTPHGTYFIQHGDLTGDGIQDLVFKDLTKSELEKDADKRCYVGNSSGLFSEAHVEKDVDGNLSFLGLDGKTYRIDMQSLKGLEDRLPEKEEGK